MQTDIELIQLALQGDNDAFRQLVKNYYELSEKITRVYLGSNHLTEDVLQEAWLDVWRSLPKFDTTYTFRPWLIRLVVNRCKKFKRKLRTYPISLDNIEIVDIFNYDDSNKLITKFENKDELQFLLGQLNYDQKQLLALRFYAELKIEEIATLLNIAPGTVKSRLHRTLETVRSLFLITAN